MLTSSVKVGRTQSGYRVRVEGQGTMRSSPAVHAFVIQALDHQQAGSLVMDLSACGYLDSTFLGCLVDLHKRYGRTHPPRFSIAAPRDVSERLFGSSHLDRVLNISENGPETVGEEVDLDTTGLELPSLGQHLLDCHRRLAEVEGPNQATFRRIADRLADELGAVPPGGTK